MLMGILRKIVFHGSQFAKYVLFTSPRQSSVYFSIFKDQRSPLGKKANYFILFNTGYPNVFDHRILFFFFFQSNTLKQRIQKYHCRIRNIIISVWMHSNSRARKLLVMLYVLLGLCRYSSSWFSDTFVHRYRHVVPL